MTITRRRFLTATGGAIAMPYAITSAALGQDATPAAGERITLGLIGCGLHGAGWNLSQIFRCPETRVLAVCDVERSLLLSGSGDVIEPDDGIIGIGSGGPFATAAARALLAHTDLSAAEIARESLLIAASICIHTNEEIWLETLPSAS